MHTCTDRLFTNQLAYRFVPSANEYEEYEAVLNIP